MNVFFMKSVKVPQEPRWWSWNTISWKIARFPREMADFRTGEGSAQDEAGNILPNRRQGSCQTLRESYPKVQEGNLNGLTLVKGWEI